MCKAKAWVGDIFPPGVLPAFFKPKKKRGIGQDLVPFRGRGFSVFAFLLIFLFPCSTLAQSLLFNVDFSDTSVHTPNWYDGLYKEAGESWSFNLSNNIERDGNPSGRFELRYGDIPEGGSSRSELSTGTLPTYEIWIGFSMYLADGWTADDKPELTGQLHPRDTLDPNNGLSPSVSIMHDNGHTWVELIYSLNDDPTQNTVYMSDTLGKTVTGRWVDYVIHANISLDGGFAQVWQNGKLVVNYSGPLGYKHSLPPSFKFGIYKWPWAQTGPSEIADRIAYYDDIKVADNKGSYSLVAPDPLPANKPPVANISTTATINLPDDSLMLDGSASSDPDGKIVSWKWIKTSGPSAVLIGNDSVSKTTVSGLMAGTYNFTLTVTDNDGARDTAEVTIKVSKKDSTIHASPPHQAPIANAGSAKTIILPVDSVLLDGSASYDPDGKIVSFLWIKKKGPASYTIGNDSLAKTVVSGLDTGIYVFTLIVKDDSGAADSADIKITVKDSVTTLDPNIPPAADAGNNQTITLPMDSVLLDGSASYDPNGKIVSWKWKARSGPGSVVFREADSRKTEVTGLLPGTYIFDLTVTDDRASSSSAQVKVVVKNDTTPVVTPPSNRPPVANAGTAQTVTFPVDSVLLDGSSSSDPDGKIISYLWKEKSGPVAYTITNPNSIKTEVTGLDTGTYVFTLTVKDDSGVANSADVKVTVKDSVSILKPNTPPVAIAGNNQTITLPMDSVLLNGSASYDPDGEIVSWKWKAQSGPGSVVFGEADSRETEVTGLRPGTYIFNLTVTDDSGSSTSARVSVVVKNGATASVAVVTPNRSPVANAGTAQTIIFPVDSVLLDGSFSCDPDGKIVAYLWKEKSGPASYTIIHPNSMKTEVTGLDTGNYIFTLTVTDDSGASIVSAVKVTVKDSILKKLANEPPVTKVGSNQTIILPLDSVVLNGSASYDPDGQIISWKWSELSGPGAAKFENDSVARTTVSGLTAGLYTFNLTTTDNEDVSVTADVSVKVNQPPVADAGNDTTLFIPDDSMLLNGGSSYDPDGTITSWSWSQRSGPSVISIARADSTEASVNQLVNGVYVFALVVTDNDGARDTADITVGVYQRPAQPPVASAGEEITIVLPQSSVTLNGTGSYDPDGIIVKYQWTSLTGPTVPVMSTPDSSITAVSGLQMGTYDFQLSVTDNKGQTSTATVGVYVLPAKDTVSTIFNVYPNPVHDQLNIQINKAVTGLLAFRIMDVNGRILKIDQFGELPMHITKVLDVSTLSPGIYFLQLIEDNQLGNVVKLIKY